MSSRDSGGKDNQRGRRGSNARGHGHGRGGALGPHGPGPPIPSPYNFVPLAEEVFFPESDWASRVSQDMPFSDGLTGQIQFTVTAKTPIYVRNGGNWPESAQERNADEEYVSFFKLPDGRYAIPGTSIKGAIRSIVEIASFGKMGRVSDHRYGYRDLHSSEYTGRMTEMGRGGYKPQVGAAWLTRNGDGRWLLTPCEFARVEQQLLGRDFGTRRGSARKKYEAFRPSLHVQCTIDPPRPHMHSCGNLIYRRVTSITGGNIKGTLVFTGQPMARTTDQTGATTSTRKKHMEFVFFDEQEGASVQVPDPVRREFLFIHTDERDRPNEEWRYWKSRLEQGERVPVFCLMDDDDNIESMGLAMMYRLPYDHSIHDMVGHTSKDHLSKRPDLADLIFGHVGDPGDALRGRVQFGHLPAQGKPSPMNVVRTVLGSPKPTFYPNYIRQSIKDRASGRIEGGEFKTYNDGAAELSGWKRYPVREDDFAPDHRELERKIPRDRDNRPNEDVATHFKPLPKGTVFSGEVRFHNLRPPELGALLWALTWGGQSQELRHNLGMAKPYGFGSVQIELGECRVLDVEGNLVQELDGTVEEFKRLMRESVTKWDESEQLQQLLAMANPKQAAAHDLNYPILTAHPRKNDFADFKGANRNSKVALLPYAEMGAATKQPSKKKQHQEQEPKVSPPAKKSKTTDALTPALQLAKEAGTLKQKDLRKRLEVIEKASESELKSIEQAIKKRPDYKQKDLNPEVRAYLQALQGLLARSKSQEPPKNGASEVV